MEGSWRWETIPYGDTRGRPCSGKRPTDQLVRHPCAVSSEIGGHVSIEAARRHGPESSDHSGRNGSRIDAWHRGQKAFHRVADRLRSLAPCASHAVGAQLCRTLWLDALLFRLDEPTRVDCQRPSRPLGAGPNRTCALRAGMSGWPRQERPFLDLRRSTHGVAALVQAPPLCIAIAMCGLKARGAIGGSGPAQALIVIADPIVSRSPCLELVVSACRRWGHSCTKLSVSPGASEHFGDYTPTENAKDIVGWGHWFAPPPGCFLTSHWSFSSCVRLLVLTALASWLVPTSHARH